MNQRIPWKMCPFKGYYHGDLSLVAVQGQVLSARNISGETPPFSPPFPHFFSADSTMSDKVDRLGESEVYPSLFHDQMARTVCCKQTSVQKQQTDQKCS